MRATYTNVLPSACRVCSSSPVKAAYLSTVMLGERAWLYQKSTKTSEHCCSTVPPLALKILGEFLAFEDIIEVNKFSFPQVRT